ncbi:MAG TPA: MBL fold metallo-hydrolase [Acidobacteriaceae bacterium]|nr:MBL fold metallo-hydrolase [Acidobacteriaceae bacterium]
MRRVGAVLLTMSVMAAGAGVQAQAAKGGDARDEGALHVYFIDVEGGQSTLFVGPGTARRRAGGRGAEYQPGESLLVDTGNPDMRNPSAPRDASRIAAVAKIAGVTKIDNLVITHYHVDHVGGLPQLTALIPVERFIDHGVNREDASVQGGKATVAAYDAYQKVLSEGHAQHLTVKPGDVLPVKFMKVQVVSADGEVIAKALPAGGGQNAACANSPEKPIENTENDRSVGMVMTFGKTRILDLGDLTWGKERGLMCPVNKVGKVDVYVVSHHGLDRSGSPALVDAVAPRIAIMDNGGHKGGAASTFETIEATKPPAGRLEGLWQLHTAEANDAQHNVAESHIANLAATKPDAANYIELTVRKDGSMSVMNSRTGESVEYPAK